MSWEAHEKLRQDLMSTLCRKQPPGYGRVTVAQARRADEALFAILAKEADGGVRRVGGVRPLDKAMDVAWPIVTSSWPSSRCPRPRGATESQQGRARLLRAHSLPPGRASAGHPGCGGNRGPAGPGGGAAASKVGQAALGSLADPLGPGGGGRGRGAPLERLDLGQPDARAVGSSRIYAGHWVHVG